tara:strand:+ start:130 stop:510 length:381 start_codon:yes stop_codon:yes gene_type:complete
VAQFVDGVCKRDAEARSTVADVFAAYLDWTLTNDIKQTMSKKGLWERLTRLSFGSHKDRTARYVYWPARAKLAVTHAGRYFSKYPTASRSHPFTYHGISKLNYPSELLCHHRKDRIIKHCGYRFTV